MEKGELRDGCMGASTLCYTGAVGYRLLGLLRSYIALLSYHWGLALGLTHAGKCSAASVCGYISTSLCLFILRSLCCPVEPKLTLQVKAGLELVINLARPLKLLKWKICSPDLALTQRF